MIHTRPDQDTYEIFNRIRVTNDPIAVLRLVKEADLLIRSPNSSTSYAAELGKLEAEVLQKSHIVVPAQPWTLVAGDSIVSDLISAFFANDDGYLAPFIHREAFLGCMRARATEDSPYCSPLLVNAICALKCVSQFIQVSNNSLSGSTLSPLYTFTKYFLP